MSAIRKEEKSTPENLIDISFPACSSACSAIGYFGVGECNSICPTKFPEYIIDKLLSLICETRLAIMERANPIIAQDELSKSTDIKNALRFLKIHPCDRAKGHTEWIKRALKPTPNS